MIVDIVLSIACICCFSVTISESLLVESLLHMYNHRGFIGGK